MTALETQVQAFERYLTGERRAAKLTVETYLRDLNALCRHLSAMPHKTDAVALTARDLRAFLAASEDAREPATLIRKVSALRAFYRFLLRKKLATKNPAAELRTPKLKRKLPTFLAVEQANETTEMPTSVGHRGPNLRDRAMLEVLYGSGLRVSELSGSILRSLDLEAGTARVLGKGSKERIVPLGSLARKRCLRTWECGHRFAMPKTLHQDPDALFLGARGERLACAWCKSW